jgi:hypothetical protein
MGRALARRIMMLFLAITRAFAADLVVDPGDPSAYASIGAAVAASSSGDRVLVAPGAYDEIVDPGGREVHVEATGGAGITSIAGARFASGEGGGAALVGFTVSRAGGSAIEIVGASPALRDLVVTASGGPGVSGGGVSVSGSSAPTLERVQFVGNEGLEGGDLYVGVGASALVSASTFDGSSADRGGAVYVREGSIDLDDSAIVGAHAVYEGGALYATSATVTWVGSSATGSRVDVSSGAAVWIADGTLTVANATFTDNLGLVGGGGAIFASASEVTITASAFADNEQAYGAAVAVESGSSLRVEDSTFDRGIAQNGGAFSVVGSSLDTARCVFSDGVGFDLGGAVYGYDLSWTDTESDFVHNVTTGAGDGGAVALELFGVVTLVGTQLTGNASDSVGAVMFADQGERVVLDGVVLDENVGVVGVVYATGVAEVVARGVEATFNEGGVLFALGGDSVVVEESAFADNSGVGAMITTNGCPLTVADTQFIHNAQPLVDAEAATLVDTTFNFNSAGNAVPMVALDGEASVDRCGFEGNDVGSALKLNAASTVADSEFVRNVAFVASLNTLAEVTVLRTSFVQNYGGVVLHSEKDPLTVVDSEFIENKGGTGLAAGGGIEAFGALIVTGSTFIGNESGDGGAISVSPLGGGNEYYVADCVFDGNLAAGVGGAIAFSGGSLVVERCLFTDNAAELGGAIAAYDGGGSVVVRSSFVVGNEATSGGGAYLDTLDVSLTNNTWVGNAATDSGGHLWARQITGASTNEVYAYAPSGAGLWFEGFYGTLAATYGVWHGNVPVDLTQESPTSVRGAVDVFEPGFAAWSDDGDFTNDDLTPGVGSPLIDAGDPSLWDVDGTRSDIGATGGPYAEPPDQDGDGFAAYDGDCNDADPGVFPGGTDDPSDGVDTDCDGFNEGDQDGDGFDSAAFGGPDCDDTDDTVLPGARELCDGVDQDCDDLVDDAAADGADWFADADGDGFTDPAARAWACAPPAGFYAASVPPDCDDSDAAVFPGADDPAEDGADQDCDGRDTPAAADTKRALAPAASGCAQGPAGAPAWAAVAAALLARLRSARCSTRRAGA